MKVCVLCSASPIFGREVHGVYSGADLAVEAWNRKEDRGGRDGFIVEFEMDSALNERKSYPIEERPQCTIPAS